MGQRKDGMRTADGFRYRGESLAIVLPKDGHVVAPLADFWIGEVVFTKNRPGGRPTSIDEETGMTIRPANMVFVELGVTLTCLMVKKGREIVAFPVSTSVPVTAESEESAPQPSRPRQERHPRQKQKREHPSAPTGTGKQKKTERAAEVKAANPSEAAAVADTEPSIPSGMDRFRERYGKLDLSKMTAKPGRKPAATVSTDDSAVSGEPLAEQLRRVSGR